eukprot:scaffold873_cov393-Prasinococcus_capsulatus_cf.AAC.26
MTASSAAGMIAVHGAGLVNSMWMTPGATVVELTPHRLCECRYYKSMQLAFARKREGPIDSGRCRAGSHLQSIALAVGALYSQHCMQLDQTIYNAKGAGLVEDFYAQAYATPSEHDGQTSGLIRQIDMAQDSSKAGKSNGTPA